MGDEVLVAVGVRVTVGVILVGAVAVGDGVGGMVAPYSNAPISQ